MSYEHYRNEARNDINTTNGNGAVNSNTGNMATNAYSGKAMNATLDVLESYYANVLEAASMNIADPISANVGFFNNSGKVFADGPKLGRTMIFMTRPNLNLSPAFNISRCKMFKYLTSSKLGFTLARMLMYSDAASHIAYGGYTDIGNETHSDLTLNGSTVGAMMGRCDNHVVGGQSCDERPNLSYPVEVSNFIPLITNCCKESGNAKDMILEVDESEGDYAGNKLVYGAGMDESLGPGEITLTFDDLYGSPIMNMMIIWTYYIHYLTKGIITADLNYIRNRIIDYTCSIYIFMLDTDQRTIVRWTKYTGCFPRTIPFGQILHTNEINLQALSQIQIPFQYNFASNMDPTVLAEFNMIAEPALYYRRSALGSNGEPTFNTKRSGDTSKLIYPADFLYGKNHIMTMGEAETFMRRCPPIFYPKKLLELKGHTGRVDELDYNTYNKYIGSDEVNARYVDDVLFYGQDGRVPTEANPDLGEFGQHSMTNRYFGQMNQARNYGQPFIVDGNKLMFL